MKKVTIVLPCYNEAERLDCARFKNFSDASGEISFLFVNDGSTDTTLCCLEGLMSYDSNKFAVLNFTQNRGKAEAVRQGILHAFASDPLYVGFWDADLATPLEAIPKFLEIAEARPDLDIVIGSRVKLLGRHIERRTTRHYSGRLFATAVSLALGISIYDSQCGAKLFRVSPPIKDLFHQPFMSRWIFDVEIIARLIKARRGRPVMQAEDVIYELPLTEWRDVRGSKLKRSDFIKSAIELALIYNHYLRNT